MSAPESVVVVGGGIMGAGIAHVFAAAGSAVVVVEADEARAAAALGRIERTLAKAEEKGKLASASQALQRVGVVTDVAAAPADAPLYVEAVPEDAALKARVLAALEAVAGDDAVLATNTSALSVGALAAGLSRPQRFCGMHFFNPVPASALVELVHHEGTDGDVLQQVRDWVGVLGKEAIVVADAPGFATSRLGVAVGLEAIRMVQGGVASAEDIDTGMRLGYRWPMGPLRLTDLVGLDVRLGIAEHLAATLGPRFEPPALLREMVERGDLGQKSGRGFYDWT
ncbi:MAG: 3-hydroxyacyl-CoA dehydrogenase family protein [Geodermatophilaceae bacterium]|nr:3-hydroxyacyl-CoA dehydrogenase family protein [Geodermatophilaceae bacterium]MDQ3454066.1 3-hydroxyacyl-CoA dehydrogenase family protein [Actinomycetota bacterium]